MTSHTAEGYDKLAVAGYIREQGVTFPADLLDLCFLFFHVEYEILRFSTEYKRDTLSLSEDRTLISHATNPSSGYFYALVDTEPVTGGSKCWRWRLVNPHSTWFVLALDCIH